MKFLSLRQFAVLAATALYAVTPSASGTAVTAAALGATAVTFAATSNAEAKSKVIVKRKVVISRAKRCARSVNGGCR